MKIAKSKRRVRFKVGDVFALPVVSDQVAIGQVIAKEPYLYIAIFNWLFTNVPSLAELPCLDILLLGNSSDSALVDSRWEIIDTTPVRADVPFPPYVVDTSDGLVLKSFDEKVIRNVTDKDIARFGRKSISSYAVFEGAVKYYLANGEHDWPYEKLLASRVNEIAQLDTKHH